MILFDQERLYTQVRAQDALREAKQEVEDAMMSWSNNGADKGHLAGLI